VVDVLAQIIFPVFDVALGIGRMTTVNPISLTGFPEFGAVGLGLVVKLRPDFHAHRCTEMATVVEGATTLRDANTLSDQRR